MAESSRFMSLDKPIEEYIQEQENKNTRAKTRRDVNLLTVFLKEKSETRKIEEMKPEELNKYICEFILSVKRKDGENYEPSSLRGLISSFNRHLKESKYPVSIIEDKEFEQAGKCLEARSKQLKKEGKGNKPQAAEALSDEEVNILYEHSLLGISSAEALLNTLWLFNSVHFGLRGCEEHRQMAWGDVKLLQEADGIEYLEYSERQTKTRTGAEPRNVRAVKPKAFASPNGPPERNPVVVYKLYAEKRPSSTQRPDAPFYLGINHTKTPSSNKSWFKSNAMGVNKLNSLMKTMAEKAGLESKRLTNHSARKRMIQKLNDNDVPPTHIMQISGHRNVQSINNYSHVSQQQQKKMSLILSSSLTEAAAPQTTVATESEAETSFTKSSILPAAGPFSGAVFHGGHFNITINTMNKSPTGVSTVRNSYKRIKRVFDSSDDDDSPPLT